MDRFVVLWTSGAKQDLQNIFDFTATYSKEIAFDTIRKIIDRESQLTTFPWTGVIEYAINDLNNEYRFLIEGRYKILYSIREQEVFVVRVFDTRQDPDRLSPRKKKRRSVSRPDPPLNNYGINVRNPYWVGKETRLFVSLATVILAMINRYTT